MLIIFVSFFLGILLSGIWFGITFILKLLSDKLKSQVFSRFCGMIAAIIPTVIILKLNNCYFLNIQSVWDWKSWIGAFFVALITALIISKNDVEYLPQGKELLGYGLEGVLMEIPQRLMMQSFVWYILRESAVQYALYISIPINALIWCMSIIIQNLIFRTKFNKNVLRELIASAFFSVGTGYILAKTLFIFYPMTAHFLERIFSTLFRKNRKANI